jgi:hypothetical protein
LAKIEGGPALSDGEGGDQVINFFLIILIIGSSGRNSGRGRRGNMNLMRTNGDSISSASSVSYVTSYRKDF